MSLQDKYDTPIAYDPTAGETGEGQLVGGAEFQVFAKDDLSFTTPLAVFDPSSGATIASLKSSSIGVLPQFAVVGAPTEVILKSGSFVTLLQSRYGVLVEAGFDPAVLAAAADAAPAAATARDEAIAAKNAALVAQEKAEAVPTTTDGLMADILADPTSQTAIQSKATFVGRPGVRQAAVPLTAPNNSASVTRNRTQRSVVKLPFRAARWRIGFANWNNLSAVAPGGAVSITGIAVGEPVRDPSTTSANRWAGDCTDALTVVTASSIVVPVDGSTIYSAWFDTVPFEAGVEKVISWGESTSGSAAVLATGNAYQGVSGGVAADYASATLTGKSIGFASLDLDVVIEYEFADTVQVGLFVGDSNTVSYASSAPPLIANAGAGALPSESWPMMAGELAGFAAVNIGVGSATAQDFATIHPRLWERSDLAAIPFDFAVVSLGTNGLNKDVSLFAAAFLAINAKLRADYGIIRIFWTTVTPRGNTALFGRLSANAAAGATTVVCDAAPTYTGASPELLIGSGFNAESRNISAVTGTGPFTLTLTAALTSAHSIGEPLSTQGERSRRLVNNYLRNMPDGISGIVDFEKILEKAVDDPSSDPRYVAADGLHFMRGASLVRAKEVVAAGVKPTFAA